MPSIEHFCARVSLYNFYWCNHGTFLNIPTAVRPQDDVCKSDKLGFPSLSFYKVSPEMDENSEELAGFFSWN